MELIQLTNYPKPHAEVADVPNVGPPPLSGTRVTRVAGRPTATNNFIVVQILTLVF